MPLHPVTMPRTGNDEKIHRRADATPQMGLQVAGIDGDFSQPVEDGHPKCPSCKALHANPVPVIDFEEGTLRWADYLCRRCELDFDKAESDALDRLED